MSAACPKDINPPCPWAWNPITDPSVTKELADGDYCAGFPDGSVGTLKVTDGFFELLVTWYDDSAKAAVNDRFTVFADDGYDATGRVLTFRSTPLSSWF